MAIQIWKQFDRHISACMRCKSGVFKLMKYVHYNFQSHRQPEDGAGARTGSSMLFFFSVSFVCPCSLVLAQLFSHHRSPARLEFFVCPWYCYIISRVINTSSDAFSAPSKYSVLPEKTDQVAGNDADALLKVKQFPRFFLSSQKHYVHIKFEQRLDWL